MLPSASKNTWSLRLVSFHTAFATAFALLKAIFLTIALSEALSEVHSYSTTLPQLGYPTKIYKKKYKCLAVFGNPFAFLEQRIKAQEDNS